MKYVVIIGDGMADFPLDQLGGKTPLMAANKPYMDMMAREGVGGKVRTIPDGFAPGSDVACMSIFGYNPARHYTGRAPIEAAGMGVKMGERDVAFRCNLVYLERRSERILMGDYSGGHITTGEAHLLVQSLNRELSSGEFQFHPGVSCRHLLIWKNGKWEMTTTPPHDITGQDIAGHLPSGDGAETVMSLMTASRGVLEKNPVNRKRGNEGKFPANSIWLWGQGKKATLPLFKEKFGLKGATVCAVDLIKGISALVGFDTPLVEGATGYIDTDYRAKAEKALELLADHDIVYIHVEAPDEASHNGNVEEKIKAIEHIDREVVGRIYERAVEGTRVLIVTDHATPIVMKTHYAVPVPFAVYTKGSPLKGCETGYDERCGETVCDGEAMIRLFVRGEK